MKLVPGVDPSKGGGGDRVSKECNWAIASQLIRPKLIIWGVKNSVKIATEDKQELIRDALNGSGILGVKVRVK